MPNHKSCYKRLRQEKKRAARNHYVKKTITSLQKKMHSELPVEELEKTLQEVYSELDKAAKKGVIHKRTASRRKARLAAHFNKEKKKSTESE